MNKRHSPPSYSPLRIEIRLIGVKSQEIHYPSSTKHSSIYINPSQACQNTQKHRTDPKCDANANADTNILPSIRRSDQTPHDITKTVAMRYAGRRILWIGDTRHTVYRGYVMSQTDTVRYSYQLRSTRAWTTVTRSPLIPPRSFSTVNTIRLRNQVFWPPWLKMVRPQNRDRGGVTL